MPSEQVKIAALTDYREPDLGMTWISFSSSFAVTIVKVLLFLDGMKMYVVGRLFIDLADVYLTPLIDQLGGTFWGTWTLTGCS
jgi:hypothetical protein